MVLKVVILGSSGLLGSALVKSFADTDFKVYEFNQSGRSIQREKRAVQIDLNDYAALEVLLRKFKVDYVLNAAAKYYTTRNLASINQKWQMLSVNALLVKKLQELSANLGFRFIQFSSDAVFSGKTGSYSEADTVDPIDFYGWTKVLADEFAESAMILRCSVIGINKLNPSNLLTWLVTRPENSQVQGFADQIWNGLTVLHLAKIVKGIILSEAFTSGLNHIVPSDKVDKYELLSSASKVFNRSDISIAKTTAQFHMDRSLTTLNVKKNEKLWDLAGYKHIPSVYQMIEEYGSHLGGIDFV